MTKAETEKIIKDVKKIYDRITECSQRAQLDTFLSYYDNSSSFLSFSSDGKMSNYEDFKQACRKYYLSLREQTVTTIQEKFNVLDANLVIVGWTGNITAIFKNGEIMKMDNYSITSVFKKVDGSWKVIHDHESALPPEIIKQVK
jgi:ketosteroid isomerase-like protein